MSKQSSQINTTTNCAKGRFTNENKKINGSIAAAAAARCQGFMARAYPRSVPMFLKPPDPRPSNVILRSTKQAYGIETTLERARRMKVKAVEYTPEEPWK